MGTPAFPNLGKHCSVDDCHLIDFLPFTCDRCHQVFCLDHRSYNLHKCPNANQNDVTVLICPLCAKGVRLIPGQDPNITWDYHVNSDCDPSNYQKVNKKRRCPVHGCKELLTFSNTIRCRDCTQEHCLKHRFGPDHKCPGPKKPETGFPFMQMLSRNQQRESQPRRNQNNQKNQSSSSWWGSSLLNAVTNIRTSAEAGMQRLSNATTEALQTTRTGGAQSSSSGQRVEQCPNCQARFSSVFALIEHSERVHQKNAQPSRTRPVIDACPKCSKGFADPVLLVQHVERDHGGSSIN